MHPYLSQVASAFLVGGTLSLLYKIFLSKESARRLNRLLGIHYSVIDSGLINYAHDSRDYDFRPILKDPGLLSVVLNDGRRWVTIHHDELVERFGNLGHDTDFFTIDPDSVFVDVLAKKTSVSTQELKNKISETVSVLTDCLSNSLKKSRLRIYSMANFPTHSVFLTDKRLVLTPYQISSGRRRVPLYVYGGSNNRATRLRDKLDDIEKLRAESKLIFDSQSSDPVS